MARRSWEYYTANHLASQCGDQSRRAQVHHTSYNEQTKTRRRTRRYIDQSFLRQAVKELG
jgi:hypothetical protein